MCNSDPAVVVLAMHWFRRLSSRMPRVSVQHHRDQAEAELRAFWGAQLDVDPTTIRLQLKSNSGALRHRVWRCAQGVANVAVYDTYLRARIQAWMDRIHESWV
ncbi:MAG TPA: hypothetical protein VKR21_13865 [Solirubrobacteraceae bacterium]|nr:hypothetical protein [Solirubrobacteraceae bacterium]